MGFLVLAVTVHCLNIEHDDDDNDDDNNGEDGWVIACEYDDGNDGIDGDDHCDDADDGGDCLRIRETPRRFSLHTRLNLLHCWCC